MVKVVKLIALTVVLLPTEALLLLGWRDTANRLGDRVTDGWKQLLEK